MSPNFVLYFQYYMANISTQYKANLTGLSPGISVKSHFIKLSQNGNDGKKITLHWKSVIPEIQHHSVHRAIPCQES